jgi:hypothetical protein
MAEIVAAMAALPVPYVPQFLHMDPLRLSSSQCRARALTVMARSDMFAARRVHASAGIQGGFSSSSNE